MSAVILMESIFSEGNTVCDRIVKNKVENTLSLDDLHQFDISEIILLSYSKWCRDVGDSESGLI